MFSHTAVATNACRLASFMHTIHVCIIYSPELHARYSITGCSCRALMRFWRACTDPCSSVCVKSPCKSMQVSEVIPQPVQPLVKALARAIAQLASLWLRWQCICEMALLCKQSLPDLQWRNTKIHCLCSAQICSI